MAKPKLNYQQLQTELDEIVVALQQDDLDVDAAVKQYQRGLEIVKQLEDRLSVAENTITELKASFETKS